MEPWVWWLIGIISSGLAGLCGLIKYRWKLNLLKHTLDTWGPWGVDSMSSALNPGFRAVSGKLDGKNGSIPEQTPPELRPPAPDRRQPG